MTTFEMDLLEYLLTFLTARRRERFAQVLSKRTRRLTLVLEDVFQQHNISAILRSCDAFGVQDVHVVESRNEYEPVSQIALGSEQWLSVRRYATTFACLRELRAGGYRIVATSPGPDSRPLEEVDVQQPLALWFGTEKEGLTEEVIRSADELVRIPMYGFVKSFNVSVAAALCLQSLTGRLRGSDVDWRLNDDERSPLLLDWCRQSIPNIELIEQRFRRNREEAREG
jgi:tRNA (guanosine-2'-O-)-methyltransferase